MDKDNQKKGYHKATINELQDKFPREGIQFLNSAYIGKVSKDIIELLEDVGYYDSKIIDGARDIKDWKDFQIVEYVPLIMEATQLFINHVGKQQILM